jgi:hypothetical protein
VACPWAKLAEREKAPTKAAVDLAMFMCEGVCKAFTWYSHPNQMEKSDFPDFESEKMR